MSSLFRMGSPCTSCGKPWEDGTRHVQLSGSPSNRWREWANKKFIAYLQHRYLNGECLDCVGIYGDTYAKLVNLLIKLGVIK